MSVGGVAAKENEVRNAVLIARRGKILWVISFYDTISVELYRQEAKAIFSPRSNLRGHCWESMG
jgi:hypothetical protein